MALKGLNIDTPLEEYKIKGRSVWVKRDDLMGDGINLPPWGKIGAVYELVKKYVDPKKPLTHLSVDGSWTGWVLAAICEELGIEFHVSYPDSKKISKEYLGLITEMYPNVHMNPIRPNMMQIMYNSLRGQAKENGWQMLPYAFNHDFYKDYLSDRIQPYAHFSNLVVSSGSGVTLSGLVRGYYREELKEEATFVQTVYSVYLNNLELNHEGKVLNQSYSITRAAKYIRSICDSKYDVVPDFEDWEMETFS